MGLTVGFQEDRKGSEFRASRILSGPFIIRVPFFLLFGFNKGIRKKQKGTTQKPRPGELRVYSKTHKVGNRIKAK